MKSALSRHPQSVALLRLWLTRQFEAGSPAEEVAAAFLAAAERLSAAEAAGDVAALWKFAYVNVLEKCEGAAALLLDRAVLRYVEKTRLTFYK